MTVTAAQGRVLRELDWANAFDQYVTVARQQGDAEVNRGNFTHFALMHPFGIPHGDSAYVLRSPLQAGESGEIHCCADVPLDGVMRLMIGDRASMLEASREAGAKAASALAGRQAAGAVVFACVSRDLVLGGEDGSESAEAAAIAAGLGADVPVVGCLSFGQIGAFCSGGPNFHSKSVAVCALAA